MRMLFLWVLPCFILKTVREIIRIFYVQHGSWWLSLAILSALIISWTYMSTISLSACILFHLVCSLQVIHFDDYGKLLQRESDVLVFMEEHIRLRYHLSKISHRFRIYLLLEFLVVTASQVVTLLQVTGYGQMLTFINGGDFAVSPTLYVQSIYAFRLKELIPFISPFLFVLLFLLGIHTCSGGGHHYLSACCDKNFSQSSKYCFRCKQVACNANMHIV